jgi:hypothetical protein
MKQAAALLHMTAPATTAMILRAKELHATPLPFIYHVHPLPFAAPGSQTERQGAPNPNPACARPFR